MYYIFQENQDFIPFFKELMNLPFKKVTELEISPENGFVFGMIQVPTHIVGFIIFDIPLIIKV